MTKAYWDAFWSRTPEASAVDAAGWLSEAPRAAVADAVRGGVFEARTRILDVGCGLGGTAAWLAERGFEVTAIDLSLEAITRARRRSDRVCWLVRDCTNPGDPPTGAPFDGVLDCGTLHQLGEPAQRAYLENLRAWTTPGAKLLFLMRYGAPLFASTTRAMLLERAHDLFARAFAVLEVADCDMDETARAPRPGLALKIARRDA